MEQEYSNHIPNTQTPRLHANLKKLIEFAQLEPGWNGYNAAPIPAYAIQAAYEIISELDHQPEIFPTANQSVQLEYEKKDGTYLEFEIFSPDKIKMFQEDAGGDVVVEDKFINEEELKESVRQFNE